MKKTLLFCLISFSLNAFTQEVISTSGNDVSGISWTIGEIINETVTGENTIVTQGFNQPQFGLPSGLFDTPFGETELYVFPNPTIDQLNMNFKNVRSYSWLLTDVTGQIILNGKANNSETIIDFRNYNKGLYIISALSVKGIKSIKIIKN